MANILLIDDDEDIHVIVRAYLGTSRHSLYSATSGQDGLDMIAQDKPDLIILDLGMPVMAGHEVYERVRANEILKQTPVMILSVHTDFQISDRMEKDPWVSTITKPIDHNQFKEALDAALNL